MGMTPSDVAAMLQKAVKVDATRTVYTFADAPRARDV